MNTDRTRHPASHLPDEALDVLIFFNPKAGGRSGRPLVERTADSLRRAGYRVELCSDVQQLKSKATRMHENGSLRAVVAAGGDGTVSLVVNQVPEAAPVAVLPLGTENLLAKYLGIDAHPGRISGMVQRGATVRLDAGQANGRMFLLMAGCGFDAEVVRRLHQQRGGHIHHLSYVKPILRSIRSYEYPELRLYLDDAAAAGGSEPSIRARWAFVVNLPRYAMGLGIAPDADGTDGRLDVCTFQKGSFCSGLVYLVGVLWRRHRHWDDCTMLRATRLRIESDGAVPYQLDGDPGGTLPVDFEVLPGRLTLVVPDTPRPPSGGASGPGSDRRS